MPTMDSVISAYIKLRDKRNDLKEKHKEELAPIQDTMNKLEAWAQKQLLANNANSTTSDSGTAYLSTITTPKIEDWEAFKNFLMMEIDTNDSWTFLDKKPSKEAISAYVEETGEVPPGISVRQETFCRIRR